MRELLSVNCKKFDNRILHEKRELYESKEEEVLGSDDKSVFVKQSLFRLKFEYLIFVT